MREVAGGLSGKLANAEGNSVCVSIPMQFKRRAGRRELVLSASGQAGAPDQVPVQPALVLALARAHRWKELLETGVFPSITELAATLDVDRSYVGRILRLTLLAPDIVEAILNGEEPSGLSLGRLTRRIPPLWEEQRTAFGSSRLRACV